MSKPKPRYLVRPGPVTSINDGDRHFITAEQLYSCYNVNPADCLVDSPLLKPGDRAGLIVLYPRKDGSYPLHTCRAWDAIGFDDGKFRVRGGTALFEAVMYNAANGGSNVKLARLSAGMSGIREVSRYVDPDTILEFVELGADAGDILKL